MVRNRMSSVFGVAVVVLLTGCAGCGGTTIPATDLPAEQEEVLGTPLPAVPKRPEPRVEAPMPQVANVPLIRSIYFEFDQSALTESAQEVLNRHANYLKESDGETLTIEGHCDERGTRDYNLALGERRADVVRRYLMAAGVQGSQIEIVSYGEERPEDPGHDESAWAKNRRAVLVYQ